MDSVPVTESMHAFAGRGEPPQARTMATQRMDHVVIVVALAEEVA
jgi:hypothetical protein